MANYEEKAGYCRQCDERVVVRRRSVNHILHLILTICTAGVWLLVWLGVGVKVGGWHCSRCGASATTRIPSNAATA